MLSGYSLCMLILAAIGIGLLVIYFRIGRLLRCMLFTAASGLAAMGFLWLLGKAIPIGLAATPFSLLTSAVLGVPGVVTMLILRLL